MQQEESIRASVFHGLFPFAYCIEKSRLDLFTKLTSLALSAGVSTLLDQAAFWIQLSMVALHDKDSATVANLSHFILSLISDIKTICSNEVSHVKLFLQSPIFVNAFICCFCKLSCFDTKTKIHLDNNSFKRLMSETLSFSCNDSAASEAQRKWMQVNWQNIVRVRLNMLDSKCKALLCSMFLESPDAIDAYAAWFNPLDCLCEYTIIDAMDEKNCAKTSLLHENILKSIISHDANFPEWVIDASKWLEALINRLSPQNKACKDGEVMALVRLSEVILASSNVKKLHGIKKSTLKNSLLPFKTHLTVRVLIDNL